MGLLIPHFSFQRFNHTGGLAFQQGVKCLIFLLVSFFFLHNECKSKNVNKDFPHHTHALLPPPASHPCSDLRPPFRGHCATPLQVTGPAAPPPPSLCPGPLRGRPPGEGDGTENPPIHRLHFCYCHHLHLCHHLRQHHLHPQRALGSRRTQLARPLQGAAQRPRFLCTLERVINLK